MSNFPNYLETRLGKTNALEEIVEKIDALRSEVDQAKRDQLAEFIRLGIAEMQKLGWLDRDERGELTQVLKAAASQA